MSTLWCNSHIFFRMDVSVMDAWFVSVLKMGNVDSGSF